MMFNNTADLLKQIAIGEDSVLELKTIEFKGNQAVFEAVVNAVVHRDYSVYGSRIRLHLFNLCG